jgi:hypothetical protein
VNTVSSTKIAFRKLEDRNLRLLQACICIRLLIFLSIFMMPLNVSARWLWVKGEEKGIGCEALKKSLEEPMINRLIELLGENISFDGQLLSCEGDECAKARLKTTGAMVALFNNSHCLKSSLMYELRILTAQSKKMIYKASLNKNISDREVIVKGIQLADRVAKGPKPPKGVKQKESFLSYGLSLGLSLLNAARYDALGSMVRLDGFHRLFDRKSLQLRYGLSLLTRSGDLVKRTSFRSDVGLLYLFNHQKVSPWFASGISGSVGNQYVISQGRELAISKPELDLVVERYQKNHRIYTLTPWIESGLMLTSGILQPHLSLRLNMLGFGTGYSSEVSFLFGLRWL